MVRTVRLVPLLTALIVGACDCSDEPDGSLDASTSDSGFFDGSTCPPERDCTFLCCDPGDICQQGQCVRDCGNDTLCGTSECCTTGQQCLNEQCVAECADIDKICGANQEICCGQDEACIRDACVLLGGPCTLSEDCPVDHFCEPTLGRCIPRSAVDVCEYRPPVGQFTPRTGCQWRPPASEDPLDVNGYFDDVVMTPAVANLTDDNNDGKTDIYDIPDIVFISFDKQKDGCCTPQGKLRIISGHCNRDGSMDTLATIEDPFVDNSSGVALGNLHSDSNAAEHPPEIVATFRNGGAIAWTRVTDDGSQWRELWRNTDYPTIDHIRSGGQPSLADLNKDGRPEVIIGNVVLDGLDGTLGWDGLQTVGAGAGVGNNAFLGPASTVADIDQDGWLEVIAGNTVYDGRTGVEKWTYTYVGDNSNCGGAIPCDGFNAVGNFDSDPEGEVVIVRLGEVFVLEHNGDEKYRVPIPLDDCANNESGPPTVADFDGDGRPEIGTASADFYVVVDFDCVNPLPAECDSEYILWKVPNHDCSSRATGSSVFDFEGDGAAEVVYADEVSFRIFDGRDGTILYDDPTHSSNTRMEMPIVVDVDNDGKSEVVVPEPNTSTTSRGGIEIWEDQENNWVRTRRIWNQHGYHVTNVTEDGQIPREEEANWLNSRLNNYRQNVQPDGLFDAPDLVIESIEMVSCIATQVQIGVTIANQGALGVAAGIPVSATLQSSAGNLDRVQYTAAPLLPGTEEQVLFTFGIPSAWAISNFTVTARVDDDGSGNGLYNECLEDNNEATSGTFQTCDL